MIRILLSSLILMSSVAFSFEKECVSAIKKTVLKPQTFVVTNTNYNNGVYTVTYKWRNIFINYRMEDRCLIENGRFVRIMSGWER